MSAFKYRLQRAFNDGSMADIARRLGIPHATVRNYFQGRLPAADVLVKIANETNVSLNWLLTGSGEMYIPGSRPIDLGIVIEERISEIVERKLIERGVAAPIELGTVDEQPAFDVESAIASHGDPQRVMGEWFKYEGRAYPKDFGIVFFQGWESFSTEEKLDAVRDAKKVLDRTLKKK